MRKLLIPLALLLFPLTLLADGGQWGLRGISRDFAVADGRLYAADGRGVTAFDVSGAVPRQLAVALSDDETHEVARFGDGLVVATDGGLQRLRIGGDGSLTLIGSTDEAGGATHVAASANRIAAASGIGISIWRADGDSLVSVRRIMISHEILALAFAGDALYASIAGEGVRVFDPDTGAVLRNLSVTAYDLASVGNTMYAAASSKGLIAIDTTNARSPKVIGSGGAGDIDLRRVAIAGNRAFAIHPPNRLHVYDLSDRAVPALVSTIDEDVDVIASDGSRVFTSGPHIDQFGFARSNGVAVRARNAETLAITGDATTLAGPVSGAATDGTFAYVVDPPYFRVLDVSTTANPREVAKIVVPEIQDSVRIKHGLAVIYGRADVNLIDISDPYDPRIVGIYRSTGMPPSHADIARDTIVEANNHSGLHVVDYSNPASLVQISGRIWHYVEVVATDDVIYAFHQSRLVTLDITNRNKVVDRSFFDIGVIQAALSTNAPGRPDLLLTVTPAGLHVFSLDDPYTPAEVAMLPQLGLAIIGADATTAYLATPKTLSAVGLADPANVSLEPTSMRVTAPMQVAAANGKVVIADRYSLRVYGPDSEPPPPPPVARRRAIGR